MMDGANMMLQQRVAKHLLLLVCLLVLNCAAQPLARLGQLNSKWLSAATLLCVEQLFFAVAVLIALLAPLWRYTPPLPPPRVISPPERRLHLTLCVWRE